MVNSTIEPLDDDKVKLSVEVDGQVVEEAENTAFGQLAKQVKLPGFRKGKVPRKVLESHFGKGIARGEALESIIPESFLAAAAEHELDIIGRPEYELVEGAEEGPVNFTATVTVRPTVNVGGYDGLRVEIPALEVTDEDIDADLNRLRGQFGELVTVDRPAESGDRVTIDIEGVYDDEPVPGLTASDYTYEVGSGFVVSELDTELVGASAGDHIEFDAPHPDEDEDGDLHFSIDVHEVQAIELPEVTDEFIAEQTDYATVDEYRASVRRRLEQEQARESLTAMQNGTAEALAKLVDVDIPDELIESQIDDQLNDMAQRLAQMGMPFQQYLEMTGQSIEQARQGMRDAATESARVDLGLRAVARAEGLEPDDDAIDEELKRILQGSNQKPEDLRERLREANQLVSLRGDIAKANAAEWLFEHVEVVDDAGKPVDRAKLTELAEADHDHDHEDGHDHAGEEEE